MKNQTLDSGLLSVFRLFTAIRLALAIVALGIDASGIGTRPERLQMFTLISLVESGSLLIYLSWSWLQEKLGRWYIPIALAVATLGPMAATATLRDIYIPPEMNFAQVVGGQWQVMIVLLLPLILVSWRYSFRTLIFYTTILALLDFVWVFLQYATNRWFVAVIMAIIFFRTLFYLLIGYVIHRLAEELRQQNLRLETANRRLSNYAMMTEQLAVSRERNRLARELHDTLAHTLSGQAVQLEAVQTLWELDPPQARETLKTILEQTRQGLNETRRAIQALRAIPLEDLGISMALEQLACGTADRVGFKLALDLPDRSLELPGEIEHTLYRVAEEALRNIEQHSQAEEVQLKLSIEPGRAVLEILDSGVGFDPKVPLSEDQFGLLGMQERSAAVGGQMEVSSQPGSGTAVRFTVEV